MFALVASSLIAAICTAPTASRPAAPSVAIADTSYQALFETGLTMAQFLDKAERRARQWKDNYGGAVVPDALLARARASGGPWKLLVVAVDGCSDSVNTVPYIARLAEQVMGMEMRIVNSTDGRWVMDAHKTADGRGATPTVVLLDAAYQDKGCFIERPPELKAFMDRTTKQAENAAFEGKMKWYDEDKGAHTLAEIVAVLEAAAHNAPRCVS